MPSIRQWVALVAACLVLPPWASRPAAAQGLRKAGPDLKEVAQEVLTGTNGLRKDKGLPAVTTEPRLTKAAQEFAEYMAGADKLSHTADGKQPSDRIRAQGYNYCVVAENIAWEFSPSGFTSKSLGKTLVKEWKESPEHLRNMLDPDVTQVGFGLARSDKTGRYYAVQDFGRPRSAAIKFQVTNQTRAPARYEVEGKSFDLEPGTYRIHLSCRQGSLKLQKVGETPAPEDAPALKATDGKRYAIRRDGKGGYRMTEAD
jgi:uncharacterized protein YkwD